MKQRYSAPLTNPDNSAEKQKEYCSRLAAMNDTELEDEAERKIWLSAYASNNPRSCYHWHADACYDEAERRAKPAIYERAYERARRTAS